MLFLEANAANFKKVPPNTARPCLTSRVVPNGRSRILEQIWPFVGRCSKVLSVGNDRNLAKTASDLAHDEALSHGSPISGW